MLICGWRWHLHKRRSNQETNINNTIIIIIIESRFCNEKQRERKKSWLTGYLRTPVFFFCVCVWLSLDASTPFWFIIISNRNTHTKKYYRNSGLLLFHFWFFWQTGETWRCKWEFPIVLFFVRISCCFSPFLISRDVMEETRVQSQFPFFLLCCLSPC